MVVPDPNGDGGLELIFAVDPCSVENLVLYWPDEALVLPIVPAAVGINPHRLDAYPSKPILRQRGEAFGAIF